MSALEALYIFDEHNNLILEHVYHGRPASASVVLPLYIRQPVPRPSVTLLSSLSPPTILYAILQDSLLFLSPRTDDGDPLLVLEFMHRVADALQEFLGSPLIATKLTSSYDIVAQIVAEMADAGVVCQTEANALRDVVETGPGVLKNLLGTFGATGPGLQSGGPNSSAGLMRQPNPVINQGPAIPWRRSNVRHTHNELYVDMVESLSVIVAPSGRPLAAFAHGNIAFTCKVSGVPDLLLTLSTGGKGSGMGSIGDQLQRVMERAVFHPCVRLNRWRQDGVLSFVPPDGRFALCGYEVDLLGPDTPLSPSAKSAAQALKLPASLEISTCLGPNGADFECRVKLSSIGDGNPVSSAAAASLQTNLTNARPGAFRAGSGTGDSKGPTLENLAIHIPIPPGVRNLSEMRPSKGEAHWNPGDASLEWRLAVRDFGSGAAVLRCSVQGQLTETTDEDERAASANGMAATTYDYDDDQPSAASSSRNRPSSPGSNGGVVSEQRRIERNRELMPTSASLSFSVKGWLASGLKVEGLVLDMKKSRGLGAEVKPYKGVKYLTVSKNGVEVRC